MGTLLNLSDNEHGILLSRLYSKIDDNQIKTILDAGSGKTSLSSLLTFFNDGFVDAIIFPGDKRKRMSILENVISERYELVELDICRDRLGKTYDLVLAHLLLGESLKWGNEFQSLAEKLLDVKSKYFIVIDILEDETVDYKYLEEHIKNKNMKIIAKEILTKREPQIFNDFVGKTYIGYVIEANII